MPLTMNLRQNEPDPASGPSHGNAWQAAMDFGIDMSRIEYLLTLTPTERLERHEQALALVQAIRKAGEQYYGYDPRHPPATE
jgi:hypothetical protein